MANVSNSPNPVQHNSKESHPIVLSNNSWTLAKKVGLALMITSVALTTLSILAAFFIQRGILQLPPQLQIALFSTNSHSFTIGSFTSTIEALSLTGTEVGFAANGFIAGFSALFGKALMNKKTTPSLRAQPQPVSTEIIDKKTDTPQEPQNSESKKDPTADPKIDNEKKDDSNSSENPNEKTPDNPSSPATHKTQQDAPPTPIRGGSSGRTPTPHKVAADLYKNSNVKPGIITNPDKNMRMTTPLQDAIKGSSISKLKKADEQDKIKGGPLQSALVGALTRMSSKISLSSTEAAQDNGEDDGWDDDNSSGNTSNAGIQSLPQDMGSGIGSSANISGSQFTPSIPNEPVTLEKAMQNFLEFVSARNEERCLTNLSCRIEGQDTPQERLILICTSSANRTMVIPRLAYHLGITSQFESSDENNEFLLKLSQDETEKFKNVRWK